MASWGRRLAREVSRVRMGGRGALLWSLRITVAAVASYVVATLIFPGTQPLLAPLTAMLVVQVTPVSLLASGLDRVVAVVSGVTLAVLFASVVPLEWWSLGLLILSAITIGQVLRLRGNLIEVAISGMLVLGVGSLGAESAAWQRVAETLVGAAVGVAANLLFPPKVATADAGQAIDGLADELSDLLNRAADELAEAVTARRDAAALALGWLGEARRITHDIPRIGLLLIHAEQGRRLNVRAVGTPNVAPGLRQGLEALEHSAIAVRTLFRALADSTRDSEWPDDEIAEGVLLGLSQTLREMAVGVDAFGQLVHTEAVPARQLSHSDERALREALDGLREARARSEDLVTTAADPRLLELNAAVLSTVKRLLAEMDLGERLRRQVRMARGVRPRRSVVRPRPPVRRPSGRRQESLGPEPVGPEPVEPEAETQVLPPHPRD